MTSRLGRSDPLLQAMRGFRPIALAALLLCSTAQGKAAPNNTPVRLVVWGMESGEETKDQDAEVAEFERRHPNIHVSMLSMGAGAMDPQKLMTAIVGGVPPDVVRQDRFTIGDWASRGAFRSLDDLLQADEHGTDPQAIHEANFVPATWKEVVYNKSVYAIPYDTDDRVLFYNKADFRAAGLDPNKPPQTWDQLISDAVRISKRSPDGSFQRIGFIPMFGQGWLYLWSWQEDGEFMSADGRHCTLDNPQTTKALQTMVDWYRALGGVDAVNTFAGGFSSNEQDPFVTGQLAMKVDGDGFTNTIARWGPQLDFGVVPVPVPEERYEHKGRFKNDPTWVTWSGGFALAIPRGAQHTSEAWQFIQWMNSPQAALIGAKAQAAYVRGMGRLYIPGMFANTRSTAAVFNTYKADLPPKFLAAKETCIKLLSLTHFRPVTFVGQTLWDEHVRVVDLATRGVLTPEAALAQGEKRVQAELDAVFGRVSHPLLPGWVFPVLSGIFGIGFAVLAAMFALSIRKRRLSARKEALAGLLFAAPWLFGFVAFTLGPVVASLVLSFCDYDVLHAARWAGASNYLELFTSDRQIMAQSLYNAAYIAVVGIPLGMVTSLAMAILLNSKVRGQQAYRTFFYVPSIVPVVASAVLWSWILNPDPSRGLLNAVWQATLSSSLGIAPPGWLAVPDWAKPALIVMGLWGAGGGMILWLAGLQSIPGTLYEAAQIDGASGWRQFCHITVPMLSPYIFFNLIVGTIGALQTFESAYILGGAGGTQTTGPEDSLLTPVVYLFNNAFRYFKMGYASALAWVLFVLILGLTLAQLKLAPRWVHYETKRQ